MKKKPKAKKTRATAKPKLTGKQQAAAKAKRTERAARAARAQPGELKDDHVAGSAGGATAKSTTEARPIAKPDPDHPMHVGAHMEIYIHVREGRGGDHYLIHDGGLIAVRRIADDDPRRKLWRPYVGPSDRAAAAGIYARSFLPKTAEAARVICELMGKSITDLSTAERRRLLSDDTTTEGDDDMATTKKAQAKATKASSKKPSAATAKRVSKDFPLDAKIHMLVKENPKRAGTKAHAKFARYKNGMTVGAFLDAGGRVNTLRWDTQRNYIKVGK